MTTPRPPAATRPAVPASPPSGLDAPAQYITGVGPARAALLARLGLHTVRDVLFHRPRRYEDRSRLARIADLVPGQRQTTQGVVVALSERRRGTYQFIAALSDDTGVLRAIWFGQRYLRRTIRRGMRLIVYGRVERAGGLQMVVDDFEVLTGGEEDTLHTGRIVPVHPATEGLSPRALRTIVDRALAQYGDRVPELLPPDVRRRHRLPDRRWALRSLHFPASLADAEAARARLAFDELLVLQVGVLMRRRALRAEDKGVRYPDPQALLDRFLAALPFPLTGAQRRAVEEIAADMRQPAPMNRLLQGDVGSGKTVVAAAALWLCAAGGYQGALMAPTEILAEQHHRTLRTLLDPLGVRVVLVTGGGSARERAAVREALASGDAQVAVGTHALLEEGVVFARLALVVVDEQHKFGVAQRAALRRKGMSPDVLVMTATPIPRTLSLTVYGDLDVTVLDELPPGRGDVRTYVRGPDRRAQVYAWVRDQVRAGRQAYVVCPLIEESDSLQAEAAVRLAARLQEEVFRDQPVGVLHGRMRADDKDAVMERFRRGEIKVLVATPVIEVGVDVPQATIMVVEDADRFGLAQLHQLRGRVGRGGQTSHCILLAGSPVETAAARLRIMEQTRDGFVIARRDLELRGPGELLGTRQHGLPDLVMADLLTDDDLLEAARAEARRILQDDPDLRSPAHAALREQVVRTVAAALAGAG